MNLPNEKDLSTETPSVPSASVADRVQRSMDLGEL